MIISFFNVLKTAWSRVNDAIMRGSNRVPLPCFNSPAEASAYLMAHAVYTGDPLGGAADFFLHPERLQAAMQQGESYVRRLSVDCDDWGSWAYAALALIPDCHPQLYTLEDSSGQWGHHVVCAYTWRGDQHGVIDTNGHARLLDRTQEQLCRRFTGVYKSRGYIFTAAVATPYPF